MTRAPAVSVVIVSRGRPDALRRCLIGVSQLRDVPFEVVIVADPPSCTALRSLPQAAHVRLIRFDGAGISAARNAGIAAAAGEVVAFIRDDAVPEPTWLGFLCAPFGVPGVMATGGFVRGCNGISWRSRAASVDRSGRTAAIGVDAERATILTPTPDHAIRTRGTNMAVRRSCLAAMGGFDPRFRTGLGVCDFNLRLAARGGCTAVVPRAEVHHGAGRGTDAAPTDLHETGADWAVFLGTHCDPQQRGAAWQRVRHEWRGCLLAHMVRGDLEPRDVARLMHRLDRGHDEGAKRPAVATVPLPDAGEAFQAYPCRPGARSVVIAGRAWSRSRLRRKAHEAVAAGASVTVIRLSPTALCHRVRFVSDGYWEHSGGLFGKSRRSQKMFSFWTFGQRVRAEADRVRIARRLTN